MNNRDAILTFARDTEESKTLHQAIDSIEQAQQTFTPQLSHFLHPGQISLYRYANTILKVGSLHIWGGYSYAERCRCVVVPDGFAWFDDDFALSVLKIHTARSEVTLQHRDILGALLGIGLKRQVLGDIIQLENEYFVVVESPLASYVQYNLAQVGRETVRITSAPLSVLKEVPEPPLHIKSVTVASMRLDAMIAVVFNMPRSRATQLVRQGKVKVDFRIQLSASATISSGSLISCRGYGRFYVLETNGMSKKGRLRIRVGLPV